jgi:hypothetical protein
LRGLGCSLARGIDFHADAVELVTERLDSLAELAQRSGKINDGFDDLRGERFDQEKQANEHREQDARDAKIEDYFCSFEHEHKSLSIGTFIRAQ